MTAGTHSEFPLCRHTMTTGRRCQSPAHGSSAYCFHHKKLHHSRRSAIDQAPVAISTQVLYPLRNALSIQQALSMVVSALGSGQIRPSRAGKMLFALQQASANLHGR